MNKEEVYKVIEKEPKTVSYKDVKPLDVARFEYGDFDNWVNAIILDIKIQETDYGGPKPVTEAVIHFTNRFGDEDTCYSNVYNGKLDFDIVGKAIKLKKQKTRATAKAKEDDHAPTM